MYELTILNQSKGFNPGFHKISLLPGKYLLEAYGSTGYKAYWSTLGGWCHPGFGGYTKGELIIDSPMDLFIVVGNTSGYNGGAGNNSSSAMTGGGATDFRLVNINNDWSNLESLKSRILVAGGGGGDEWGYSRGGAGGGLVGGTGTPPSNDRSHGQRYCYGGGQTYGGSGVYSGRFGMATYGGGDLGGCGGGGWYGGGDKHLLRWRRWRLKLRCWLSWL